MNPIVYELFNKEELNHTIKTLAQEYVTDMANTCAALKPAHPEKDTSENARLIVMEVAEELCRQMILDIKNRYALADKEDEEEKKKNAKN